MTAFTKGSGRIMTFHGTLGEVQFAEENGNTTIKVLAYTKEPIIYNTDDLEKDTAGFGHGGGDYFLCEQLYDMIMGNSSASTSLEASIESHLMALAAEESRKTGKVVEIEHK